MEITFTNILTGTTKEMKQTPQVDGSTLIGFDEEDKLLSMTKEELVTECERREATTHKIWAAIMVTYGPEGFSKVLRNIKGAL